VYIFVGGDAAGGGGFRGCVVTVNNCCCSVTSWIGWIGWIGDTHARILIQQDKSFGVGQ